MEQFNDGIKAVKESISTFFRHILPGIVIIILSSQSIPSRLINLKINDTSSILVLGAIAMAIGNVWYVFHRYGIFQIVDFLAYYFKWEGEPVKTISTNYRKDAASHVLKFFISQPELNEMGRHIRDRFSSFNYMYIVSEALIVFTLFAEDGTLFQKYAFRTFSAGVLAFIAATYQYSIVRAIDAKFVNFTPLKK